MTMWWKRNFTLPDGSKEKKKIRWGGACQTPWWKYFLEGANYFTGEPVVICEHCGDVTSASSDHKLIKGIK